MAPLYYDRIQPGNERTLSIHVARPNAKDLEALAVPILALEPDEATAWTDVRRVVLDLTDLEGDDRELIDKLAVDQPVHLALDGADLTAFAFDTSIKGFGMYVVTLGVCLFAFSTMISWSYYGEKGAEYLLGPRAILPYKFMFVIVVFTGMVMEKFQAVYDFSDATTGLMVLCMPSLR